MVLGNDFGQKWWHEKCLRENAREWKTSSNMACICVHSCRLLVFKLKNCFFTNAYMGLRGTGKSTGASPGMVDPKFVERCQSFFLDRQTSYTETASHFNIGGARLQNSLHSYHLT